MLPVSAKLDLTTILVVADLVVDAATSTNSDWRHDLEKSSISTVTAILQAIESLGIQAIHLSSLEELSARAAQRHAGDVVLSVFGGERSVIVWRWYQQSVNPSGFDLSDLMYTDVSFARTRRYPKGSQCSAGWPRHGTE